MAEALVSIILKQLATLIGQEFKLVTGVEEDISRLQSNLMAIQTLLEDAEEKQRKEHNIKLWLDKLKAASYDMEDALDQWNTELFKLKICYPKYVPLLKRKTMAEALVSEILLSLTKVTIENAQEEFKLVTGVEEDISRLESNLMAIKTLLEDAEEKQMVEPSIKLWINNLKAASFDVEDVLDEWNTLLFKSKLRYPKYVPILKRKVCDSRSCLPFGPQICINHEISAKIKSVNKDLDEIAKDKDRYQLMRREIKQSRALETSSYADMPYLYGRDLVKTEIISKLLAGERDNIEGVGEIQTISIGGMGGIGKTSLARMIFNDVNVSTAFDNKTWVCVSDKFDQANIARAVLESLDKHTLTRPQVLETILCRIHDEIKDKKILIVFDDVWIENDEDWASLKGTLKCSKSGSRILVTTRKDSVMKMMGSSHTYHLEELSHADCWLILSQVAFKGRIESECKALEAIGKRIAEKCKGLPLAAKALGSLLREKTDEIEWENVLNSDLWELQKEKFIYAPLLLSYYDLPSKIKRCLLYCAVFPKGYEIWRNDLILHWMAQGYLNRDDESLEMELLGEEYFNYLVSRCFFQEFGQGWDGMMLYKMHDLIHDFVQFLTKNEVMAMEVNSNKSSRHDSESKRATHLRVTIEEEDDFLTFINGAKKLRSLFAAGVGERCDLSSNALKMLFNGAKSLRLLEFGLNGNGVGVEKVPKEVIHLIHLRYLDLSYSWKLKRLPEAVCELYNLQVLNLLRCYRLKKLPDEIWKLVNLRYLYTEYCDSLTYYPKGIGNLTLLRRLDRVIARADGSGVAKEFSIGDMENLDCLHKDLKMKLVGNEIDRDEATRAKLHNKRYLNKLTITLKRKMNKHAVSQLFLPPPNLRLEFTDQWDYLFLFQRPIKSIFSCCGDTMDVEVEQGTPREAEDYWIVD